MIEEGLLIQQLYFYNYFVREMKERKGAKEIQDRGDFRGPKGQR